MSCSLVPENFRLLSQGEPGASDGTQPWGGGGVGSVSAQILPAPVMSPVSQGCIALSHGWSSWTSGTELGTEPPPAGSQSTQASFVPLRPQGGARAQPGFTPFLPLSVGFRIPFLVTDIRKKVQLLFPIPRPLPFEPSGEDPELSDRGPRAPQSRGKLTALQSLAEAQWSEAVF